MPLARLEMSVNHNRIRVVLPLLALLLCTALQVSAQQREDDVVVIGSPTDIRTDRSPELTGVITEAHSGESIAGATIYVEALETGTSSDSSGRYRLRLPVGRHEVRYRFVGFETVEKSILIYSDGNLDIELSSKRYDLGEVVVEARGNEDNVLGSVTGIETMTISEISELPSVLGEADVVNSLKLLPGVTTVGEGAIGYNVRGGRTGQNLVLLEGAPLFNPSHVLGFFSVFNPDVVKEFSLYKGHVPARYGGRLSSVLDVRMKREEIDEFKLRAGVGIAAGRLSAEIPFNDNNSSLLLAGRGSYSGWILSMIGDTDIQQSSASFYDGNAIVSHSINPENRISFSFYGSRDRLQYSDRFGYSWKNRLYNLSWKSMIAGGLVSEFSAVYGAYSATHFEPSGIGAFTLKNGIRYYKLKEHLVYTLNERHTLNAGIEWNSRFGKPEQLLPYDDEANVEFEEIDKEQSYELSFYAEDMIDITEKLQLTAGLRYTLYRQTGPARIFQYRAGAPRRIENITDTTAYSRGKTIAAYDGLEPRLSARYRLDETSSIKASYNRTAQYIHQITNNTSPTPSAIWQTSTPHIKPMQADQFSLGYFRNFNNNIWETSLEIYYKKIDDLVEYIDFADLHLNEHLETELLAGTANAYGAELSIRKNAGRWTGWLSYAYNRTYVKVAGDFSAATLNEGDRFPASFDRPHNLTLIAKRRLGEKSSFSMNFTYNTGRPITAIESSYEHDGVSIPVFSGRNAYRIPDYIRLDISFTIAENIWKNRTVDPNRPITDSMTITFYNLLSRENAFTVYYDRTGNITYPRAQKLSILGAVIPSATYNISF